MDRGVWQATVHRVTKSRERLKGLSMHVQTGSWGFPGGASGKKNPAANAGDARDMGLIPEPGRSPGGGHGNQLQCYSLENPMDRRAWRATVHQVAESNMTEATQHTGENRILVK